VVSSSLSESTLTRLFVNRVQEGSGSPHSAMEMLIARLRQSVRSKGSELQIDSFLRRRNVVDVQYRRGLECDGFVEPLGNTFGEGFRIVVNGSISAKRAAFTLAHELCHTFFYERVPEIKFFPHGTDEVEERLCNLGAAELLMPGKAVARAARPLPVCLDSLRILACKYHVSTEAMLLRLRTLNIWRAELSSWIKMTNGSFVLDRIVGGKRRNWRWLDESVLPLAWETGKPSAGRTYIECVDKNGRRGVLPVSYDLERRSGRVVVLWGSRVVSSNVHEHPLFDRRPNVSVAAMQRPVLARQSSPPS
jgi:Zn-dependent peptidase ImmA (M78 family)